MRIAIMVEGKTERAFKPHLVAFLETRLSGRMPRLDIVPYDGRLPKEAKLKRIVERLLNAPKGPADEVIALTDVYTGTEPPEFIDAADAKSRMRRWVGPNPAFHPHAAQHDFEAWLLPFWDEVKSLAGSNHGAPQGPPEAVNHGRPPSAHIKDAFRTGSKGKAYVKARDAGRILRGKDLAVSAARCPELKSLLNTILTLSGGEPIA